MSKKQIFLAFFLVLWTLAVQANEEQIFVVDDGFSHSNVTQKATRVYASNTLTLSSIQQHIDQWLSASALSPIPEDAKVWSSLTIRHEGAKTAELSIVAANINAQKIEGYVVDQRGSIREAYTGNELSQLGHIIRFTLSPGEQVDVFISLQDSGATFLPLGLWQSTRLDKALNKNVQQQTLFVGALASLILYFFISYFVQHNVCRFWFSVASLLNMLFVLQNQGFHLPIVGEITSQSSLVMLFAALTLLTSSKVTHYLLFRVPKRLRTLNYTLSLSILVSVFALSPYAGNIAATILSFVWILLQITLSIYFRDRRHALPAVLYGTAWVLGLIVLVLQIGFFLLELPSSTLTNAFVTAIILTGVITAGIAIETGERGARIREFTHQEKRIANLRQFYELFRNSAEGLYTSKIDGSLLSVNPAMCQLFGFNSQSTMLEQVANTADFYANPEDRLLLVNELAQKNSVLGREIRGKRRDGSEFWFSISCQIQQEGQNEYMYGSIFDITERKQSSLSLEYLATHDSLTGVLNRREFERKLNAVMLHFDDIKHMTLMYIDLDRFKLVNDSCGHRAGDELIQNVANLIHETVGAKGDVARLGGDEFAVMCTKIDEDESYICANKLLNRIQDYRFFYENKIFTLGASIGFLHVTQTGAQPEQLISMADAACYIAKERGRNQIHRYSPDDASVKRYESELNWLNSINDALENDKFLLYCQQYRALNTTGEGIRIEVLLRMLDENGELVLPGLFLPTAERYNLGNKVDKWVIEHTFEWLEAHPDVLNKLELCNINLSGQSLADSELKLAILNAFERHAIPYDKVCFEITETMAVVRLEETLEFIKTFRNLGSKFALDDFGSGFSSYSYLKNLPVDCVKIDGSFIRELLRDPVNQAMVSSINDVAKAMNMQTVAEFVEDDATLTQLGKVGVDFAQGYGVARPAPLDSLL